MNYNEYLLGGKKSKEISLSYLSEEKNPQELTVTIINSPKGSSITSNNTDSSYYFKDGKKVGLLSETLRGLAEAYFSAAGDYLAGNLMSWLHGVDPFSNLNKTIGSNGYKEKDKNYRDRVTLDEDISKKKIEIELKEQENGKESEENIAEQDIEQEKKTPKEIEQDVEKEKKTSKKIEEDIEDGKESKESITEQDIEQEKKTPKEAEQDVENGKESKENIVEQDIEDGKESEENITGQDIDPGKKDLEIIDLSNFQYNTSELGKNRPGYSSIGYVSVIPQGEDEAFQLPFEFTPEIDEGSYSAVYNAQNILARVGALQNYSHTDISTVSIKARYFALAENENSNNNSGVDSWIDNYTLKRIQAIQRGYESLVFPKFSTDEAESINAPFSYNRPPFIKIILGDENSTLFTYPKKVYENGNRLESHSNDLKKYHKVFIATQVKIEKDLKETPLVLDDSKNSEKIVDTFGFSVSLDLLEVTKSYMDMYPDFESYFNTFQSVINAEGV